ncbi:MAG: glycosyltransferase family 4 protein [Dehalococcoidia bacterium]
MHVLMVCALDVWALPGSGGAPTLERTLRAYAERGHRVTYVTATIGANAHLPGGRLRAAPPATPPEIAGVAYERFHLPSLQESRLPLADAVSKADQKLRFALLFPMLAARRAERVLDREAVDVLYAYEVHGALAARRLRRRWRGPVVARFQGTVMRPALDSPLARLRKYEEVRALRLPADLYIMTNDGTQGDEVLARLNPQSQDKVRFWRNGLDLDRLRPATPEERIERRRALDIPSEGFVMITASRLATWKRVDRAVSALPQIVRDVPNALLLIVGDGEERDRLEALSRELGVIDHVRFAGAVPQEGVVRYMQASDVFLAPADLSNAGNPLLEAMTCGVAIVTVDAGDTGELIRDGETGRLLPDGDPAGISRAVIELARDASLRERLAAGARRYAETNFWTWEARLAAEVDEVERLAGVRTPDHVAPRAGIGGC